MIIEKMPQHALITIWPRNVCAITKVISTCFLRLSRSPIGKKLIRSPTPTLSRSQSTEALARVFLRLQGVLPKVQAAIERRLEMCHCHKLELTTSTSQYRYMAEKKAVTNAALLSVNITVDVLSSYCITLATIYQKLICAAESAGRADILQKVAKVSLPAYRNHLPLGYPELNQRLQFALLNMSDRSSSEEKRSLLVKVYESAVLSHGEDHVMTKE
ncbi:hypothetical protein KIN20_011997 [Parelaphostrongylus tenuis]|uniref:Uncharacterized protein n=1 Tax=Parelaphostrongylus tenuis TaxID=148309 RepID=A0AAD5MDS3_PARTN|nr:hypothetical protein KIN20_011997 [Parelaphostrongylus tenuis]